MGSKAPFFLLLLLLLVARAPAQARDPAGMYYFLPSYCLLHSLAFLPSQGCLFCSVLFTFIHISTTHSRYILPNTQWHGMLVPCVLALKKQVLSSVDALLLAYISLVHKQGWIKFVDV